MTLVQSVAILFARRIIDQYFAAVGRIAIENPKVNATFIRVWHMLLPPTALFRPDIAVAAVGALLRGALQRA